MAERTLGHSCPAAGAAGWPLRGPSASSIHRGSSYARKGNQLHNSTILCTAIQKPVPLTSVGSPQQYAPSVFEKYSTSVLVGKKEVTLHLYDTAGQEDYDRLRPLSYQNTNVVLICYDVMNPTSFDNVLIKWSHEVNHFCRGIPIVLVGCKTDLRKDKEQLRKLRSTQQEPITYSQGEEACRQMKADAYLECSAKFRENIEAVFKETATIALNAMKKAKRQAKSKPCTIL
ncbi:rho-related GTP-binding protein RhoF isoform X2 [Varanus komodoensis]|uniref:rho-related GTP-binding protein RhoF isoform X2 n=1 Tax=Varanus komodoensis TaxID=61221 RepID=UPI001CF79F72|nr:rho-related GTP-binding protein RhoF isoform X2 [Varanus komodoensis]